MSAVREAIEAALDGYYPGLDWTEGGTRPDDLVDRLVSAVEAVPVAPVIKGNGSMDGVTPILFFEPGSDAIAELRYALNMARFGDSVRITIDEGLLKWKVSDYQWSPGYPSERENGGNG